ncbi:MDR family MFS transporter [Microlunatus parietis]|uniref:EmrB/QacA subfamily drug resistance transporter n=1 Tax=Microlunatus parietis TaxID=682979 RepID=A0A7Y9I2N1_9ACTN|nr:MDR family MFS transporter [Microlunatus parietis]NYE69068.1 EmrB/QacA subfamily drug resistance transporter [Microlunatus parietis]
MSSTAVAEQRTPQPQAMSHRRILESLTGMLAALFTAMISSNIVATALPVIIGDLNGTQRQYTWVITASLLATTVSTPIWGKLSDLFNKKLLIQLSIGIFVIGSVAAGFATTVPWLIGFRILQGLGMGGLTALVQAIMASIIAPRERGRYAGYMGAVMAVSTVSGPLLGGFIVDSALGWRWCFFVCVPLAIISLIVLQRTLRVPTLRRPVKIDYAGALLISVGASLPLLWVTFAGTEYAWWSWETLAFLGGTAILITVAIIVELRVKEPLVPLRVLSNRTAALMIIASAAVGIGMFGGATFLGQYFQLAKGYTPTHAGLMIIPLMVAMLISSTISGQIITRTGRWKGLLIGGGVLLVAGLAGFGTITHTTPDWQTWVYMALMGLGMGAMMQNIVLAVQNTIDVRDIGAASATLAFFRTLGGAIGVSVLGAVLAAQVKDDVTAGLASHGIQVPGGGANLTLDFSRLPPAALEIVRAAYGDATGHIFQIAAIVAVVALIAVILVREVPLRTTVELVKQPAAAESDGPAPRIEGAAAEVAEVAPAQQVAAANGVAPVPVAAVPATGDEPRTKPAPGAATPFLPEALDDPTERISVAALDVLAAAQASSRDQAKASDEAVEKVRNALDELEGRIDTAIGDFHQALATVRDSLAEPNPAASLGRDGVGGNELRSYEYGLLVNSQRTADRVTTQAQQDAERMLTEAKTELADLEGRIEQLRKVEEKLRDGVGDRLRDAPLG